MSNILSLHFRGRALLIETQVGEKTAFYLDAGTTIPDVCQNFIAKIMGALCIVITLMPGTIMISIPSDLQNRTITYMGNDIRRGRTISIRSSRGYHDFTITAPNGHALELDIFFGETIEVDELDQLPDAAQMHEGTAVAEDPSYH